MSSLVERAPFKIYQLAKKKKRKKNVELDKAGKFRTTLCAFKIFGGF